MLTCAPPPPQSPLCRLLLSKAQLYDTYVQHGEADLASRNYLRSANGIADWTNEHMGGAPVSGVNEVLWLAVSERVGGVGGGRRGGRGGKGGAFRCLAAPAPPALHPGSHCFSSRAPALAAGSLPLLLAGLPSLRVAPACPPPSHPQLFLRRRHYILANTDATWSDSVTRVDVFTWLLEVRRRLPRAWV